MQTIEIVADDSRIATISRTSDAVSIQIADRGGDAQYHPVQAISVPIAVVGALVNALEEITE